MVEITGKTRQTLRLWTRKHGCPRNADATYNLTDFLQWYSRWQQNKAPAGHLVFQVRKTIRETLRELVQTSSDTSNTVTKTETTALE